MSEVLANGNCSVEHAMMNVMKVEGPDVAKQGAFTDSRWWATITEDHCSGKNGKWKASIGLDTARCGTRRTSFSQSQSIQTSCGPIMDTAKLLSSSTHQFPGEVKSSLEFQVLTSSEAS